MHRLFQTDGVRACKQQLQHVRSSSHVSMRMCMHMWLPYDYGRGRVHACRPDRGVAVPAFASLERPTVPVYTVAHLRKAEYVVATVLVSYPYAMSVRMCPASSGAPSSSELSVLQPFSLRAFNR